MKIRCLHLLLVVGFAQPVRRRTRCRKGRERADARVCGMCHEAAKATSVKLTREGWVETIDRMKAFGAGGIGRRFRGRSRVSRDTLQGRRVRPLDMNTAEAIDLESVLQLLRRESKAVLDYRSKAGQFSSLDDLKGLDPAIFKKIEAKKDRIVFQTQPQP